MQIITKNKLLVLETTGIWLMKRRTGIGDGEIIRPLLEYIQQNENDGHFLHVPA